MPAAQPQPVQPIEPGYANVSLYGVGVGVGVAGARWRGGGAGEPLYESAEGAGAAYWWWRVQACRRHARPHPPTDLCTMPRVGRGRGLAGRGAGGMGGVGGAELRDALSASCGSIADLPPPCLLLLHASHPAPRPSCSYHVLPESHRAPRRPRPAGLPHCCDDDNEPTAPAAPAPPPAPPAPPEHDTDDSDAEGS